ncbi:Fe(3+) ABC transporter substrate-binding protein [Pikeienuella piscinae]|uniref:Fe(3+) ABC transporter substrate-binding protein n=1 Tax=Pikeienuella piscinae TaxID=2748098 RepID=A0A7L5BTR8_9RHOB|nr:Fe(3+) ABC transporter substrate-binding protein [Pikeienuella piscinae]QIE54491.1 Fe(3+) ABC transporter substrate-binding protein [Pikeienuella piscinae]
MFTRIAAPLMIAALAAPAVADVNVYSYRQPDLIAPLTEAFTKDTGINVNVVFLNKGMVERLKAEGDLSPADLIFTVDISRLLEAVNAGLTQSVSSPVLEENIPPAFRDPEGHWFGVTARARIVYASKERVKDEEVTTYEALAEPQWKGRICTRSGSHSYTLGLLGAMIVRHGEAEAEEWMKGIKANLARKPEGSDRSQVKAIWAGECDISLGNNYYMVAMLKDDEQKEWAESVRIMFPHFENGGTHMNISGVSMTKSAPNRDEALQMMEWLSSDHAQKIYAEIVGEYPVEPGVPPSDLVKSFGAFEPDTTPLTEIGAARPAALKIVERIGFDD